MKILRAFFVLLIGGGTTVAQPSTPASVSRASTTTAAAEPLSAATRAKIARMTPLFDGQTFDGWVQAPPAPESFSGTDVVDLDELARKLTEAADPVSAYVRDQLDEAAQKALATASEENVKELTAALVKNLNRIAGGASIADEARFRGVKLRAETEALRRTNPTGLAARRLNRMLLEDAYPKELYVSPLTSWAVKDGAMASTGAGRGVIYTAKDYTRYRLIFLLRHVSGKPDHQPCVLIFCERPAPGEKGLDALGGIQFQPPNGGHWDYRPGRNNDGKAFFANPTKTRYDSHAWCQVELLVNAKDGAARMAVAAVPGTRATENLVFRDATAGKTGPIAWQMHNAGLFDEFKDVRIEVEPAEDRLITVE
jgi:3-keto-disaccharide hydrolase